MCNLGCVAVVVVLEGLVVVVGVMKDMSHKVTLGEIICRIVC